MRASFVYDGLGRREEKTVNGNLTEFLYDRLNPVQETSGATVLANILPGLGIDEFLTRTDVVAGVTSNFLTDALGSPVAVTDNSGTVQTEYTYEPFGKTTFTGNSNSSSYQYTGRENDGMGLYYYRARYYHPALQRFISEDPIAFYGRDYNLYAYVWNKPLGVVDPSGLKGLTGGVGGTAVFGNYAVTVAAGVYLGSGGVGVYGTAGFEGGGAIVSCCVAGGYYPGDNPGGSSTNFELGFGPASVSASFKDGTFTGATAGKWGPSVGAAATKSTTVPVCLLLCNKGKTKSEG